MYYHEADLDADRRDDRGGPKGPPELNPVGRTADPEAITHVVVHGASSLSALIAATTLVPGSDAVLIMPIQVGMVVCFAKIHGREVSSSLLRSAATASVGQILGKGLSRTLLRYTPGPGNLIRASVAGGVTEVLGWAAVADFRAEVDSARSN